MTGPAPELAFALDVPSAAQATEWMGRLHGHVDVFKVGLELFIAEGASMVRAAASTADCFLDLKLHDIPATMARAASRAASLGARDLTIHASAGPAAIEATRRAVEGSGMRLLAVTALTSLDAAALKTIGMDGDPAAVALRLGKLAFDAGAHGLVCSAHECAALRALSSELVLVVPGVRPAGGDRGDQKRTATPAEAVRAGATMLVVGRPIRNAEDPILAARAIRTEMNTAMQDSP